MSDHPFISLRSIGKRYQLYNRPQERLMQPLLRRFGKKYGREFWALQNISFSVRRGETLGIIGRNGSGKSTLLEIIAGTLTPTMGEIQVTGRVVALLELGSGFNLEFTGRENAFLTGAMMGISRDQMKERLPEILHFADIGSFIDQPVKIYSSGMYVRLAFSILKGVNPDIFLIDEALAVGDIGFSQKCFQYLEEKRKEGKSFVLVSHDMQAILRLCDWVLLLDNGEIRKRGKPIEVVTYYYAQQAGTLGLPGQPQYDFTKQDSAQDAGLAETVQVCPPKYRDNVSRFNGMRYGTRKAEIIGFASINGEGKESTHFRTGEPMGLEIYCRASETMDDLTLTFQVTDRFGTVVFGQNSYMATRKSLSLSRGEILRTRVDFPCSFFEGEYRVALGATACNLEFCNEYYDYLDGCLQWNVGRPSWRIFHGVIEIPTHWVFRKATE